MNEYWGLIVAFGLSAGVGVAFLVLHRLLAPPHPTPAKSEPFECGQAPFRLPSGRFSIRFYLVAMLFILFDVELVFLFPWAVVYRDLGLYGFLEMAVFMGIVVVGFVYAWRKGALEWN